MYVCMLCMYVGMYIHMPIKRRESPKSKDKSMNESNRRKQRNNTKLLKEY